MWQVNGSWYRDNNATGGWNLESNPQFCKDILNDTFEAMTTRTEPSSLIAILPTGYDMFETQILLGGILLTMFALSVGLASVPSLKNCCFTIRGQYNKV